MGEKHYYFPILDLVKKFAISLLSLVGVVSCADNKLAGKFVLDLLKPALSAAEINTLVGSRDAGHPTYHSIPTTRFTCSSKSQPGFYADVEAQCVSDLPLFDSPPKDYITPSHLVEMKNRGVVAQAVKPTAVKPAEVKGVLISGSSSCSSASSGLRIPTT
ncbi:hypothetical protein BV898_05052 [Hypsibius exemplaris]|uniref:Uncharacterized protein n=1 Tax=Hypsibius exemplaris TaxID=2072580 RepID=A0A1W0X0K7_HYPEX|nr:hypothetical protein BV898_05052 [Hypsibius exemplaris]